MAQALFPQTAAELLTRGRDHANEIEQLKRSLKLNWYPFDSLTALPLIAELLGPEFGEVRASLLTKPVLDLGCGDGDLGFLFSLLGADVDAIDSSATNFNQMEGVRMLNSNRPLLRSIHDLDLDSKFELPSKEYGLTLFLGTLYHLKNPYYLLEKLAFHTEWCLLSTRIAQFTPKTDSSIEMEPVAYLADGREINQDSTNYWIFSASGLLRILQRTRWAIRSVKRVGCLTHSNPIAPDADERMFVLVQSRVFTPGLQVRRSQGWYAPGEENWCWTAKQFSLDVVLPLETSLTGFRFTFYVPEAILLNFDSLVVACFISGRPCGSTTCHEAGLHHLEGTLPESALHEPRLMVNFEVESAYPGDGRELGVCVALSASSESGALDVSFHVF